MNDPILKPPPGRTNAWVFLAFLGSALIAYRDCFGIFIPGDSLPQLYFFDMDILFTASEGSLATSPYFAGFTLTYLLYEVFGMDPAGWILTSILLHTVCGFFVFLITRTLVREFVSERGLLAGFFSGLFFLISPYQTEAVLWQPSNFTVLFAALCFLAGLHLFLLWITDPKNNRLYFLQVPFLLGALSYESSLVLPGITLLLFVLFVLSGKSTVTFYQYAGRVLLPQAGIIFIYLLSSKLVFGEWLFHGGSVDLGIPLHQTTGTALKYVAKFFFFFRYAAGEELDSFLRGWYGNKFLIAGIFMVFTSFILFVAVYFLRKNNRKILLLAVLFLCFIASLIPVLHLDSSFLRYIYPDRYGYLPSVFFYVFAATGIVFLFRKYSVAVLIGYAVLCWIFLMRTTAVWAGSNDRCNKLIEGFRPFLEYETVYILNVPAYYNGVPAFRSSLPTAISMKLKKIPLEKIQSISEYYHEAATDTLRSVIRSGDTLKVQGPARKYPFFSAKGGWPSSYTNDAFSVTFDPSGCAYSLVFKKKRSSHSVIIKAVNDEWKIVD